MRCSDRLRRVALVAVLLLPLTAAGQDLGVVGPVYPIAEPILLDVILAKLEEAQKNGVLARLQRDAEQRTRRGIEEPVAVPGITRATKPRTFYFDPSIVVSTPITDADGRVIVAPGTVVNPLDTVSLSQPLVFLDGRDANQVTRAQRLIAERGGRAKVILTGGSYLDLMRRWKRPVFFDQQGAITEKLGIRHVPAIVYQEGKRLRIDEIL